MVVNRFRKWKVYGWVNQFTPLGHFHQLDHPRKWSTPPVNGSLELMTTSYLGQKNYGSPENPPLSSVFSGFPRVPNHLCRGRI